MQALARLTSQALGRKAKSAKWLRSHRFRTESCALSHMKNGQRSAQWFQNFQNDYKCKMVLFTIIPQRTL